MEKLFTLLPPLMPNYILVAERKDITISVTELSEQEAEGYAQLLKDAFMVHYNKRKELLKHPTP